MKYYAVRQGHKVGIFKTWEECKQSVDGYSGAEYKSFTSLVSAQEYLDNAEFAPTKTTYPPDVAVAYVDGSYNTGTQNFGCGVVILYNGEETTFNQSYDDSELSKMRNVAGEICGAILAMRYCLKYNIKTLHIYYDYQGIEKWCTGAWKTNKPGTARYKDFYDSVKDKINISFHKVKGHSGDKYNDLADKLAKQAAGIE